MNKCHFMGRLTRDPEIRYTNGEPPVPVANYTLAVDRKYKREDEQNTDFLDFVCYGGNADFAEKYCKKGTKLVVTARCQKRSYTNKEGRKINVVEFVIEDQEFAESKRAAGEQQERIPTDGEGFMQIPDGCEDGLPFD